MSELRAAVADAPFVFVVGKGGVGKTTAAGGLALELADAAIDTHLISTDPAHSLSDLFGQAFGGEPRPSDCAPQLLVEEFDASARADAWLARSLDPVGTLIEHGTYLDAEDVAGFSRLALPGVDELMGVLRLVDLAHLDRRVVVDTAPTGHTLRLLDAASTHESIARALRAMADKAGAVAGSLTGRSVRFAGEAVIDELQAYVASYRADVLRTAAFVVATRAGDVVAAETLRLLDALRTRGLHTTAFVSVGDDPRTALPGADAVTCLRVPWLAPVAGCAGLRAWREALAPCDVRDATVAPRTPGPATGAGDAASWLEEHSPRLALFAGKGGVGKSTCAAAAAVLLAASRDVLLCSADPAGSLADVLGAAPPRLRTLQIDPGAQLARLRDAWRTDVEAGLERIGISGSAALDRRVIASLWELTPPGLDELAATAAMLSAAQQDECIVLDAAPTGHFLRLLAMPELALGWTHQLMRVIVKYGIAGATEGAAGALLQLARELRALQQVLRDPGRAGVFLVTLEEPMVRAETDRLIESLLQASVPVTAVIVNHAGGSPDGEAPPGSIEARVDDSTDIALERPGAPPRIRAPHLSVPPVGADALREFIGAWKIGS